MILGEIFIEPAEHLWPAVPLFLAAVVAFDTLALRPVGALLTSWSARRRWLLAALLTILAGILLWSRLGFASRTGAWYPAWSILLLCVIAARAFPPLLARMGMPWARPLSYAICLVGVLAGLASLARAEEPASRALLAWCLAALVCLASVWSWRGYHVHATLEKGRQRLPLALRTLAICLLGLLLLNPVSRNTRVRYDRACLLVLLDDSRSMGIRDVVDRSEAQPVSRAYALNTALTTHRFELKRIGQELDVLSYCFTDHLVAADALTVRADGEYTALGDAIQQAYESVLQDDRPVAGVLLCSDGANNLSDNAEPVAAAAALAAGRVPLWTVGVGSEVPTGQTRSIVPRTLTVPRRVGATNELPVTAEFTFVGFKAEPARIELLFDDDLVDHKPVRCTQAKETRRIQFAFVPKIGGLHKVTVRAKPERFKLDGETPSMTQYVHVTDDVIRVLYLEGKPRYESTFIIRALAASKQIHLQKSLLTRPKDEDLRTVAGGPTGQWQWYHVMIIGDMAPGQLDPYQMNLIRQHVGDDGCGLAILGTRGFLGRAALAGTPLADVLPVDPDTSWLDQRVAVVPTPAGLENPVLRIVDAPGQLRRRWGELPPMQGACRFTRPKPAAQVLATDPGGDPLIVTHTYGAGRVLTLGFDSTWQWCMLLQDGTQEHRRFWRQVVLWLANRRPVVWIAADHPRYQLPLLRGGRQRVEIRAGVDSPISGQPLGAVKVEARMIPPSGDVAPLVMTSSGDHYVASADPRVDGLYKLELTVRADGREIGHSAGEFVVESPDMEMVRPLADFDLLREMAAQTYPAGGKFVSLDGLDSLLKAIGSHDYRRRHEETVTNVLIASDRWRIWFVFCALVLTEWIVRKRRGLV